MDSPTWEMVAFYKNLLNTTRKGTGIKGLGGQDISKNGVSWGGEI